ncbi:TIGR00730 family Rossman fold protein [Dactylosporangium fulvum]|uniref:Cytokinin riboside 5'-monophosphate phosphoribohydrolase n=1 Tax=Dactylosporangium fulvum TaxID=53359 RepID=A0ABY5W9M4_9ACTN|nr:TIGR00730 family Rossman fold protein [Dactylosporangium fulvum]UWP85393.1 TIGR00730 family Rossman fold protein [Dactylosporangium fulvum]
MTFAVCVFCSASESVDPRYLKLAEEVGTALAARGWTLVSGGEHVSMMGAVAAAARAGGAQTVGIVSNSLLYRADRDCDRLIVTSSVAARKQQMTVAADAFLALPGGLGTCDEIFSAWTERVVGAHAKPIVLLDPDDHFGGLLDWLADAGARGFVREHYLTAVRHVRSVADALDSCAQRLPAAT